ncbi:hypothetical protein [Niallia circulans]|uniref:hypothetical protein n=1 Tax=Niallia circulans TaxID=1397 RepID=UPI0026F26E4A|nr:hypothetical protein [Niallia circulans]
MNESWKEIIELFENFEIAPEEIAEMVYAWISEYDESKNKETIMQVMLDYIRDKNRLLSGIVDKNNFYQ